MNPTYSPRGETIIRRNARGSYSILFADGSLSVSFIPTRQQAEAEAARLDAELRREALRGLRNADLTAVVVAGGVA